MLRIRFAAVRKISRATEWQAPSICQKFSSSSRNNLAGLDTRAVASQGMSSSSVISPSVIARLVDAHQNRLAVIGPRDANFAFENHEEKPVRSPSETSTVPAGTSMISPGSMQSSCVVGPARKTAGWNGLAGEWLDP